MVNHGSFCSITKKRKELVMKTNLTKKTLILVTLFMINGLLAITDQGSSLIKPRKLEYKNKLTLINRTGKNLIIVEESARGTIQSVGLFKNDKSEKHIFFNKPKDISISYSPTNQDNISRFNGKALFNLTARLQEFAQKNKGKDLVAEIKYDPKEGDQTTFSTK